ncbi:MAG: hypothetical protein OXG51_16105 [Gammaproteobacteria bacterium]|nr:hypothetical protein [Gammaproteobacteria bacterium]
MLAICALPGGDLAAGEGCMGHYTVSVGEVAVTHHAVNDVFSRPDLMVRVQRQDPVVLDQVDDLGSRIRKLSADRRAAGEGIRPLLEKRKASEVTPGKPLTEAQADRLAVLGAEEEACAVLRREGACRGCSPYDETEPCPSCAKCEELKYLSARKAESEVEPGEPLTEEEARRLDSLERQAAELDEAVSAARAERERLLETIIGYTSAVSTNLKVVDFRHERELLEVFPDDVLEVAVLDDDIGEDDLYGQSLILAKCEILSAGELEMRMPNVRHVRLRFRPSAP